MSTGIPASDVRIAVIGVGAIGSALLSRLLHMPFSVITLVDGDRVEERNLDRQGSYAAVDIGRTKVEVAAAWARNAPVQAHVEVLDAFLNEHNAEDVIAMHDIVADCTDDIHVRGLIDRTCGAYGVPLVSGAVHARQSQVIVLHAEGDGDGRTREHLFSGRPGAEQDGCDMRQVPEHTIGETARRMGQRIRELLDGEPLVNGRIELYDGSTKRWTVFAPPLPT